ncbi:putative uncharacterized transposon-derived protein F52C9.6 [Varanus komodoensis]|nr:putative uncharacterized transposon-derived protein F52C9.6 [Varanus komodoensis]
MLKVDKALHQASKQNNKFLWKRLFYSNILGRNLLEDKVQLVKTYTQFLWHWLCQHCDSSHYMKAKFAIASLLRLFYCKVRSFNLVCDRRREPVVFLMLLDFNSYHPSHCSYWLALIDVLVQNIWMATNSPLLVYVVMPKLLFTFYLVSGTYISTANAECSGQLELCGRGRSLDLFSLNWFYLYPTFSPKSLTDEHDPAPLHFILTTTCELHLVTDGQKSCYITLSVCTQNLETRKNLTSISYSWKNMGEKNEAMGPQTKARAPDPARHANATPMRMRTTTHLAPHAGRQRFAHSEKTISKRASHCLMHLPPLLSLCAPACPHLTSPCTPPPPQCTHTHTHTVPVPSPARIHRQHHLSGPYTQLNAEFQRIARRDKNAFLNEQCKEKEENNGIGRTRDLVKKIGDMKGTFHAKMGKIKDQNGRDLTEAEEIKKRWQDYTEELYKKELNIPDNHDGAVTDLEPDILECEVKRALGSLSNNKASGGDNIPAELFKILKDDAVKVPHSICQQIWKTQQWPQDRKRSVYILVPKDNAKEYSNYRTIALISHASKVMLKILQARPSSMWTENYQKYRQGFEEGEELEIKLPTHTGSWRKLGSSRKTSASASLTMLKPCVDHKQLWQVFKEMGVPDHLICLLRNRYAEHIMRRVGLDESPVGIKIAGRNINNLRYADDTTLMAESEEELKSLLMRVKEESAKVGLKLGSKITTDGDCSQEIKRHLFLGRKAMANLVSILKSRDITLPTEVHIVKAMFFPVAMYGCESWTIRKAEHQRIEAVALWCWRRLPWTTRRSNRSVLEEINPDCSLEGQILKMKLKYFGHLMRRKDSLEKSQMLGTIDGKKRRGRQRMRWLDGVTEAVGVSLSGLRQVVEDRKVWKNLVHGVAMGQTRLRN